jgi:tripartite-type tricarboxylate transporter receptor subunit TctC
MNEWKRGSMFRRLAAAIAVLAFVSRLSPAMAQAANDSFYAGKTITIQVGATAGGDYSNYALLLAHNLGRHIPGSPSVVVQYVPGAGGLLVANNIYNTVPRDGTVIGITNRAFVTAPVIANPGARYDSRKFGWLGSSSVEYAVCFSWKTSPIKTVRDLTQKELIVGAAGGAGAANTFSELANRYIGAHMKTINGYPGSTEIILAMERGEVEGYCGLSWIYIKTRKPEWLANKDINLLFQMGPTIHPDLPNVPFLPDLARSPEDKAVIDFVLASQELGRPFFAPPGVPETRLKMLQDAFAATQQDADYKSEADKMGLDLEYVSGEKAKALVSNLYLQPQAVVSQATTLMK